MINRKGSNKIQRENSVNRHLTWNKLGKQEKPVAKATQELWYSSTRSVYFSEWSENNSLLLFRGNVYVPDRNAKDKM